MRHTPERIAFLADGYRVMSAEALTCAFNREFGTSISTRGIRSVMQRNGITSGRKNGELRVGQWRAFTAEQANWLAVHSEHYRRDELVAAFNAEFGTDKTACSIVNHCKRRGLYSKRDHAHRLTGAHQAITRPVGSERVTGMGWREVKIAQPNVWRGVHQINWEAAHGPVPEGYMLTFADGYRGNCDVSNLMLVSRGQNVVMNKLGMQHVTGELKRSAILLAELHIVRARRMGNSRKKQERRA